MQLEYNFTVPVPVSRAWGVLLDVERIAPCLPGATLTSFDGEAFTGTVRVKLGPVNLTYQGKGRFVSRDEQAGRVVIEASGRDSRGTGTAATTATMTMRPGDEPDTTVVTMAADLSVTGRPAQFGRGMVAEVGGRLVGQFADCLATRLAEADPRPAADRASAATGEWASSDEPASTVESASASTVESAGSTKSAGPASVPSAPAPARRESAAPEAAPVDLMRLGAGPALRLIGPYVIGIVVLIVIVWALVGWLG